MSIDKEMEEIIIPDWQVTVTTVQCGIVAHDATLLVYKDWHVSCAYYRRFGPVRHHTKRGLGAVLAWLGVGSHEQRLPADCHGPAECPYIEDYRHKLREEALGRRRDPGNLTG